MAQITKEQIQAVLLRTDEVGMHAVGRALIHLLNNQTLDEARVHATKYHNEMGFTPNDAKMGSSMAEFYARNGYLSSKQMAYWNAPARTAKGRIRITKYWKQILEAALRKQREKEEARMMEAA